MGKVLLKHCLMFVLRNNRDLFFRYIHMIPEKLNHFSLVKEQIEKKDIHFRKSIPADARLAITLRYPASGKTVPITQLSCKKKHRFQYCFWDMYCFLRIFERILSKVTIYNQWLELYIGKIRKSVGFSTRSWSYNRWEAYAHWLSQVKWNFVPQLQRFF